MDLFGNEYEILVLSGFRDSSVEDTVYKAADSGNRSSQLVRNICDKGLAGFLALSDIGSNCVNIIGDFGSSVWNIIRDIF